MSDPFIGEVRVVAFNFAPQGWALCNGQTLAIQQNSALFSLLGTTFGGNGVTTFNLPDYRGRSPVGMGNGLNLSPIVQGQTGGTENVTLSIQELPAHTHVASAAQTASNATATLTDPTGAVSAIPGSGRTQTAAFGAATATPVQMAPIPVTVQPAGNGLPVPLRNPYLGTNFIIALSGIFPSRP